MLAILALIDIATANMVAVATIAAGAGLLLRGATIASRSQQLMARLSNRADEAALKSGLGVEEEKTLVAAGVVAVGAGLAVEATPALARIVGRR